MQPWDNYRQKDKKKKEASKLIRSHEEKYLLNENSKGAVLHLTNSSTYNVREKYVKIITYFSFILNLNFCILFLFNLFTRYFHIFIIFHLLSYCQLKKRKHLFILDYKNSKYSYKNYLAI